MSGLLKSNIVPLLSLGGAAACGAAWGVLGLIGAVPLAALAMWSGHRGWELRQEERLEEKSLAVFRALESPETNKDRLVRNHDLTPKEADAVINWLVRNDLLTANWDELEGPVVFRADSDAFPGSQASPLVALPPPEELPVSGKKGKTPDVFAELQKLPEQMLGHSPFFGSTYGPKNPGTASLLSIFLPGLGHLYAGDSSRAIKVFFGTYIGLGLFGIGVLVWFWQIGDAAETARKTNLDWYERLRKGLPPPG